MNKLLPCLLFALLCASRVLADQPLTKIVVDRDGIFRVTDSALRAAGRSVGDDEIERLGIELRGTEVPSRLLRLGQGSESTRQGSAEGRFALEFLGSFARGKSTYESEFTTANAYRLVVGPPGVSPRRIALARPEPVNLRSSTPPGESSPFTAHHEINRKLIRFSGDSLPDETWFWEEIKATDVAPAKIVLNADNVVGEGPVKLRVRLVGYSHLPTEPDHTVDVGWNEKSIGKAVFDGENAFVFEATVPAGTLREGENTLTLRALGETTGGIDLVLLDWVELTYLRKHRLGELQQLVFHAGPGSPVRLAEAGYGTVSIYDTVEPRVFEMPTRDGITLFRPSPGVQAVEPGGERVYRAVRAGEAYPPVRLAVTRPADLRASGMGADFVIVTHAAFRKAADRLAAQRRIEGLKTEVVDVEDIYDVFNDSMLDPEAIRRFLQHAYASWTPRPRYVLLVGDASWDYKNTVVSDEDYADWHWSAEWARQVPKNASTARQGGTRNDRLFIPTFQYQSPWGHAASDNHFVNMTTNERPDLAIGRLPVATLAEAEATVGKILAYGKLAPGALDSTLFIANDEVGFQTMTDIVAEVAEKRGYEIKRIYPLKEEKDNRSNTKALMKAWNKGPAIVVFNGHGGRYIWRTGPPDLTKNHDLFTLEHLDQLKRNADLPVVISLTCYSAPFDHPVADSIGEKLLRLPDKGAIAVVASSWRNAPPIDLGRQLVEMLGDPRFPRLGDAYLQAKRDIGDIVSMFTYNLLGDPTTPFRGLQKAAPKAAP